MISSLAFAQESPYIGKEPVCEEIVTIYPNGTKVEDLFCHWQNIEHQDRIIIPDPTDKKPPTDSDCVDDCPEEPGPSDNVFDDITTIEPEVEDQCLLSKQECDVLEEAEKVRDRFCSIKDPTKDEIEVCKLLTDSDLCYYGKAESQPIQQQSSFVYSLLVIDIWTHWEYSQKYELGKLRLANEACRAEEDTLKPITLGPRYLTLSKIDDTPFEHSEIAKFLKKWPSDVLADDIFATEEVKSENIMCSQQHFRSATIDYEYCEDEVYQKSISKYIVLNKQEPFDYGEGYDRYLGFNDDWTLGLSAEDQPRPDVIITGMSEGFTFDDDSDITFELEKIGDLSIQEDTD